jgi:hypothetical protein
VLKLKSDNTTTPGVQAPTPANTASHSGLGEILSTSFITRSVRNLEIGGRNAKGSTEL